MYTNLPSAIQLALAVAVLGLIACAQYVRNGARERACLMRINSARVAACDDPAHEPE